MPDAAPNWSTVRDLKALEGANGQVFTSVLVIRKLAAKTASNGNPFLGVDLGDRTGSFSCTVFSDSPVFETIKAAGEGAVIRVEGKVEYYQSRLSPRLTKAGVLSDAELAAPGLLDNLVELSPENPEELWSEFNGFIDALAHPELKATVRAVFEEIGETFR
ncbi:MAG TPA: OB-fold nucleic acid binding domain-containing protein, partial [Opitutaceae bacterium]|nr:OB-fold nucleic acid binding domain-containing protein [Opitutaceae bacterium]